MFEHVREDVQSVFYHDPAARSTLEALACYLDLHAVWLHRLAHGLWTSGWKWLVHLVSSFSHWMTGIEVRPGARIGRRFFIGHDTDIVIGETAEVGDDVTFYQSTTLDGTTWNRGKRHPTLDSSVVVDAGAKVLNPFAVDRGAKVGSNAVTIKEAPPGATVVNIPGRIIMREDTEQQTKRQTMAGKLDFNTYGAGQDMPDPVARAIGQLLDHLQAIDGRLEGMCQVLIALGSDYYVKGLPILREEDFTGVKDRDGNPAV